MMVPMVHIFIIVLDYIIIVYDIYDYIIDYITLYLHYNSAKYIIYYKNK